MAHFAFLLRGPSPRKPRVAVGALGLMVALASVVALGLMVALASVVALGLMVVLASWWRSA
jgi:hypothetical protein